MDLVKQVYELRQKFMIIGLTGRTGSGCSTVADLLNGDFQTLAPPIPVESHEGTTNDERKYRIEYNFLKSIWEDRKFEFQIIKASDIIFYYALMEGYEKFVKIISLLLENETGLKKENTKRNFEAEAQSVFSDLKTAFEKNTEEVNKINAWLENKKYDNLNEEKSKEEARKHLEYLQHRLPEFRNIIMQKVVELLQVKTTKIFQEWGNNIRQYGSIVTQKNKTAPSQLAHTINRIIKLIRNLSESDGNKLAFIVIDSLRNPFEVHYFRERYSAFYLMSITTDEANRKNNLHQEGYDIDEINQLDGIEYPSKRKDISHSYYSQDVEKCVELSDIHIAHNNQKKDLNDDLKRQLVHFVSLILHPGLTQPTHEERLMQIANVAKLNSGCISRQVGAVITDKNFSVKAIGWNTVAKGQTPCALRTLTNLYNRNDLSAFSKFEKEDIEFRQKVELYYEQYNKKKNCLNGIPLTYCFKDIYTVIKGEKNQVHTRSLHAEENAFLQLAKYGSEGIDGGYLFTTASPCELCAKKAYQLGISKIFYIDIYPGISFSHIIQAGERKIDLIQFKGAIGRAYESLYNPIFPLKDEIEYLTGVSIKKEKNSSEVPKQETEHKVTAINKEEAKKEASEKASSNAIETDKNTAEKQIQTDLPK